MLIAIARVVFSATDTAAAPGLDVTAIMVGAFAALASVTAAWFAFRGRQINPLENGVAFVSSEARTLAEFHRDDAQRAYQIVDELRAELATVRQLIAQQTTDEPE